MSADFLVTIHDPARRAQWQQWLGTETVCVRSPIPTRVDIDGLGPHDVFLLDEQQLTPAQQRAVCEGLAAQFDAPVAMLEDAMRDPGIVILAEGCSVMVLHPTRWLLSKESS